ncbi:histidine phosphatase family protein [Blastopirellula sp. J2-11]|uniref:SixA phosphatase family protein n=1 Tax=Blastopirellula sp. J2-11 TaxID=2943192 RepID=UPI0021C7C28F|nr:histidine phosphatase family protein [Blastopirellula sp. J2-11]UUO09061.1 histidine phosphatase family protein [Blastopirellula sp. J2-11]
MPQRKLILMRHAKSSWKGGLSDHERPLNGRGRAAAPLVAAELQKCGWAPEMVVASNARRTVETWERMRENFSPQPPIVLDASLYLSGYSELVSAAAQLPDFCLSALFLGHNPGWEMAASQLAGQSLEMATGMAVLLTVESVTWQSAFSRGEWKLVSIIRPRELDQEHTDIH